LSHCGRFNIWQCACCVVSPSIALYYVVIETVWWISHHLQWIEIIRNSQSTSMKTVDNKFRAHNAFPE
jgi:hypothetical protein